MIGSINVWLIFAQTPAQLNKEFSTDSAEFKAEFKATEKAAPSILLGS